MQLKKPMRISRSLATATCGLLGALPSVAVKAAEDRAWQADAALLYYSESDGRVQDISARANLTHNFDEDRSLQASLAFDSLTGASPSGAVKTDAVQTFTRPSAKGNYEVAAGEQPLDISFRDARASGAFNYLTALNEATRVQGGLSVSVEHDYIHLGANARWQHDFYQRNTTPYIGLAFSQDSIKPEGGVPIPFAVMPDVDGNDASNRHDGDESKTIVDALVGVTQVLTRRALLEVAYSYSHSSGYHTDPYKILSVVDANTGRPVANPGNVNLANYIYERRPESRTKHSLFTELRYAFDRDSIAVNYRYLQDDWDIRSHTLEARFHWQWHEHQYFEPQVRYYQQSAADFYRTVLFDGATLPQYASADYRLAELTTTSFGVKYGWRMQREYTLRLEYYQQTPTASAGSAVGVLANYDLTPSTKAIIAQFGCSFGL